MVLREFSGSSLVCVRRQWVQFCLKEEQSEKIFFTSFSRKSLHPQMKFLRIAQFHREKFNLNPKLQPQALRKSTMKARRSVFIEIPQALSDASRIAPLSHHRRCKIQKHLLSFNFRHAEVVKHFWDST